MPVITPDGFDEESWERKLMFDSFPYICLDCNVGYNSPEEMSNHIDINHNESYGD